MSGPSATVLSIPEPLETDDDDVSWALQTAAVQWKRGAREEAIAWLRRGADAAVDGGLWERASQLNVIATGLEKAISGAQPEVSPPSAPRFPPRVPTPASQSFPPPSFRPSVPSAPVSPQSMRSGSLSSSVSSMPAAPQSARTSPPSSSIPATSPSYSTTGYSSPASPPSTPAAHSKWPTGFPPSAVPGSGPARPYAPPPPLPAVAKAAKPAPIPPIPPKPKPIQVRAPRMTAPEIHLGDVEELDMTEAELVEYGEEEVTYRGQVPPGAIPREALATAPPSAPSSAPPDSLASLPSYDLDEDPMDGTTALPPQSSYPTPSPSSYPALFASESGPPPSVDDINGLPAFPLEDSVPAGPPSRLPDPQGIRSNPLPQISLRSSPLPPVIASSKPPASAPAAPQKFARPVHRAENKESSSLPPMLSMDELDAVAVGPDFDVDEAPTSIPAPISEKHDDRTDVSKPPASLPQASAAPVSLPPDSTRHTFPEPISMPPPSVAPVSSLPPVVEQTPIPASRAPASSERAPRSSVRPSQPPQHLDRDTPIPSSISGLKPISLRGIALSDVRGLCDLPEDAQRLLRQRARIERMGTGEDLSFFSVVLVLEGWVKLMPAIADVTCATAAAGEVVFTQGTLDDGIALRVVAGQNGTTLATWDRETFDEITQSCPWVADELRLIADSFQALAGTSLGMLGERLDDALREVVTSRCQVLTLLPGEVLVQQGKPVPGMHIVGAGVIEIVEGDGKVVSTVAPGDFLLTAQVLAGGVSPHTVRAASTGALVLFAPRMAAHELLVSVPPLLEILAG